MEEAVRLALDSARAQIWTSMPATVLTFNAQACTVNVQPAIGGVRFDAEGFPRAIDLPVIEDVAVIFPGGGGHHLTFPLRPGDQVTLVFACRPLDAWWQSAGSGPTVHRPASARMHDLSDAFAVPGVMSKPRVISAISQTDVELRTDDGLAKVAISPAGLVTISAPAGLVINGNVQINGAISQGAPAGGGSAASSLIGPLTVTQDVTAGGKSLKTHTHPNGSPNTGQPN
tara:strand:- start:15042 stop:15728 length:687 start_codon:yes stop_codon:yes gene_type:complete